MIELARADLLDSGLLMVEIAALFFAVTVAVQLFQARFGPERLRRWMGGRPLPAALKGIALGFLTPFCTFTAVPMLVGLRQDGVPAAGYMAFIVAAPVLDPVLFGAIAIIAGLEAAVLYAAIAFGGAVGLAIVAEHVDVERRLAPVEALLGAGDRESPCPSACDADGAGWQGLRAELPGAARSAVRLLTRMAPILLVGIGLSLLIEHLLPPDVTARLTSVSPSLAIPVAAALGTPLYTSTAVLVPVADGLSAAGVGIGAIVALTIAGAGANLPEFAILSRLDRPPVIVAFFAYVFGVAVAGGYLAQAILG